MNGKTNQANSANVYQAANSSSDAWGAWSVTCTPTPPLQSVRREVHQRYPEKHQEQVLELEIRELRKI